MDCSDSSDGGGSGLPCLTDVSSNSSVCDASSMRQRLLQETTQSIPADLVVEGTRETSDVAEKRPPGVPPQTFLTPLTSCNVGSGLEDDGEAAVVAMRFDDAAANYKNYGLDGNWARGGEASTASVSHATMASTRVTAESSSDEHAWQTYSSMDELQPAGCDWYSQANPRDDHAWETYCSMDDTMQPPACEWFAPPRKGPQQAGSPAYAPGRSQRRTQAHAAGVVSAENDDRKTFPSSGGFEREFVGPSSDSVLRLVTTEEAALLAEFYARRGGLHEDPRYVMANVSQPTSSIAMECGHYPGMNDGIQSRHHVSPPQEDTEPIGPTYHPTREDFIAQRRLQQQGRERAEFEAASVHKRQGARHQPAWVAADAPAQPCSPGQSWDAGARLSWEQPQFSAAGGCAPPPPPASFSSESPPVDKQLAWFGRQLMRLHQGKGSNCGLQSSCGAGDGDHFDGVGGGRTGAVEGKGARVSGSFSARPCYGGGFDGVDGCAAWGAMDGTGGGHARGKGGIEGGDSAAWSAMDTIGCGHVRGKGGIEGSGASLRFDYGQVCGVPGGGKGQVRGQPDAPYSSAGGKGWGLEHSTGKGGRYFHEPNGSVAHRPECDVAGGYVGDAGVGLESCRTRAWVDAAGPCGGDDGIGPGCSGKGGCCFGGPSGTGACRSGDSGPPRRPRGGGSYGHSSTSGGGSAETPSAAGGVCGCAGTKGPPGSIAVETGQQRGGMAAAAAADGGEDFESNTAKAQPLPKVEPKASLTRVFSRLGNLPHGETTLMVRNIPVRYSQEMLLSEWPNESFDFLYLPISMDRKRNGSFAFVNFVTSEAAFSFATRWQGARLQHFSARKPIDISLADTQGRDENMLQTVHGKTFRIRNAHFQPAIFKNGARIDMSTFLADFEARLRTQGKSLW